MPSILREWVERLGLRHQGALLAGVRGCDTAPKADAGKALVRCYRAAILNAHCGDPAKAKTFIEAVPFDCLTDRMEAFRKSCDHYPLHFVTHLLHGAEIIGYKGPRFNQDGSEDQTTSAEAWLWFYHRMCRSLHLNPETDAQLDARLNADESAFAALDRLCELENCAS